ncbi:MAG: class III signal peptide-containing protein [Eggerthellaceae bacterium]|nr:class III signal peptide-containing protein [Eggerthellaceae bacterium]
MKAFSKVRKSVSSRSLSAWAGVRTRIATLAKSESGQGTTEYAILVGVLVVIAILAITVFRPRLQELWNAIAEGINSL